MDATKSYPLIRTIAKSNCDGKWIELWFREEQPREQHHFSTKGYMFWEQIEQAGLGDYTRDHGIVGLKVLIECIGYNEHITKIYG